MRQCRVLGLSIYYGTIIFSLKTFSLKDSVDRMFSATVYKLINILLSLIRYGTFRLKRDILTTQSCDALVTYGPLPTSSVGSLGETLKSNLGWIWYHLSWIIILSLKRQSNRVCSATIYKFKILPSLLSDVELFVLTMIRGMTLGCCHVALLFY